MQEEILYNAGLYDVLDQINESIFKNGIISEKTHLENHDKIELARKTRKQETGTITTKQEGTEL